MQILITTAATGINKRKDSETLTARLDITYKEW